MSAERKRDPKPAKAERKPEGQRRDTAPHPAPAPRAAPARKLVAAYLMHERFPMTFARGAYAAGAFCDGAWSDGAFR
jgi:hypothetical protein